MSKKTETGSDSLPAGLSQPAIRALHAAGYKSLKQLTRATEAELLALHGFGPNAMARVLEALREQGLSLARPACPDEPA